MRFTRDNPEQRVIISLLRGSTREIGERAIYTFLGPRNLTRQFLLGEFTKRYGTFQPLAEAEGYVSVEVSTHLLPTIQGKTPNEVTFEVLGPDAVFLPILVVNGWLHIRVLSANAQGGARFEKFLDIMRNHMQPDAFDVYSVREYKPEARLHEATQDITPRQQEVMEAAYEMGYWDEPRRCNLDDIARHFGVSKAAVHKSLSAGERKVMATFFADTFGKGKKRAATQMLIEHRGGR
ncbi:MAG: helix-turn-helix domain-containing protein [Euryarchaeota archaeon]|nr:helix-turn-helix domain-containing protein [Euryarchaeota archaeon]